MIIILNKEKIELNELEDKTILINKLCVKYDTLPKYLYFEPELKIEDGYQTNVTDFLNIIKEYKGLDIINLYKSIKEKLIYITLEDIIHPWLFYSKSIKDLIKMNILEANTILIELNEEIKKNYDFNDELYVKNIKSIIQTHKTNFEKDIEDLKDKLDKYNKDMKPYYDIKKGVEYLDIIIEKSEINYILDMEYITLLEIFNNIVLNKSVTFASYNNFYKISKEIIPFEDWKMSLNEYILIRVLEKKNIKINKKENYSLSIIGKEDNYPVIRMICNLSNNNITQEEYKDIVLKSIQNPKIKDIREELIKGTFIIPNQQLDKYVFADLVMNNNIFSKFLYINERESATKTKSEIYIYLSHPIYGLMTCNMVEYNDIPTYDSYIRVHITKSKNMKSIYEFQKIISKLFIIYNTEYDNIIKEYRQYIPDFCKKIKEKVIKTKDILRLKDVAPQILEYKSQDISEQDFIESKDGKPKKKLLYTRMCEKLPRVVNKEEAEKIGNYMIYPKDDSFVPQNYYVCDEHKDTGHIYPGLTLNKLSSYEKVIGLPCCFKEDHSKKQNTLYRQYYYDEEITKDSKKILSQKMILTNKFVNITSTGILPKNILNYFEYIDPLNEYRRTGMSRGPNSFIECVLEALGIDIFKEIIIDSEKRTKYVNKVRKEMLSDIVLKNGICRQELYNKTNQQIYEYVNSDEYFDPKMFITLLEKVYNCNIYLFTRNINDDGELSLPYYSQYYLKYENNNPCIFIYENPGNVADNAMYPQCELIINFKENNSIYSYQNNDKISRITKKLYENISMVYLNTIPINMINLPSIINNKDIKYQLIDNNGKVRILYIEFMSKYVSLITNPLPPLMLPEIKKSKKIIIKKLNIKYLDDFITNYNIVLTKKVVINGIIKQLIGYINNVNNIICIPIHDYDERTSTDEYNLKDLVITNELVFIENKDSILDLFNYNKKYARYICEYAIWLLSNYLYKNGYKAEYYGFDKYKINEILTEFFKKNIIIIEDYIYDDVKEKFTYESSLLKDNKLVLMNQTMYDRVFYFLKLYMTRNYNKVFEYRLYSSMETYFQDITDMTIYSNQVILYGEYAVEKWISERISSYILYDYIYLGINNFSKPYFFKNDLVYINKIYLAQNINNLRKAINIAKTWIDDNYNISIYSEEIDVIYESDLYIYKNNMDIKLYKIKGIENSYNIKILGYKINFLNESELQNMYTVLLPL